MPEPVVDTNIRRVLIFLLKLKENISLQDLEKKAKKLIPEGRSRDRHNALMDYGSTHLTARKTKIKSLGKQSKFEGSDREVRGRILKQLTKKGNTKLSLSQIQAEFPHKNIEEILKGMQKEHLIKREQERIRIE